MFSKLNFWKRIFLYLAVPWFAFWIAKITVESQNPEGSGDTSGQLIKVVLVPAFVFLLGLGVAEIRAGIAKRKKFNEKRGSRSR